MGGKLGHGMKKHSEKQNPKEVSERPALSRVVTPLCTISIDFSVIRWACDFIPHLIINNPRVSLRVSVICMYISLIIEIVYISMQRKISMVKYVQVYPNGPKGYDDESSGFFWVDSGNWSEWAVSWRGNSVAAMAVAPSLPRAHHSHLSLFSVYLH